MSISRNRSVYKIVLVGDPRVGKTSIRKRYLGEGFQKNYMVTLGADFVIKRFGTNVMQIWDLAGQEVFKSVREGYYKGANGIILVYDIGHAQSFQNIHFWLNEILNKNNKILPMILVGNKADLRGTDEEAISVKDAEKYANELRDWSNFEVPYIESSALSGENIHSIFEKLAEEIENEKSSQEGF